MNPTLNIHSSDKPKEASISDRHNGSFYDPIARVLSYLSKRHARQRFEDDMSWLLAQHKYAANGTSHFSYGKIHYTKDDLITKVSSIEGRKFFTLLAAYHPLRRCNSAMSLLTGDVTYQQALLARLNKDLGVDAVQNTDSTFAYCRAFLRPIFDYDAFRDGKIPACQQDGSCFTWIDGSCDGWCCAEFIRRLGVKYCVYCNADSVYSFNIKDGRSLPYASALDHFLPRHLHPYFALNLNNLVPCCTRCNVSLKGKKDTDLRFYASPYDGDLYGAFKIQAWHGSKEYGKIAGGSVSGLQIKYVPQESDAGRRAKRLMIDLFKWEDVYNGIFADEMKDIFRKVRLLTPSFRKWLREKGFVGENSDRLLYGCSMRKSEVCRYRFAKVIQDFAERYGDVKLRK